MVNAHCLRSMHLKHAVNSHSTRPIFDNPLLICIFSCVDWAPCKCDWGELRSTNLERELYLCLTGLYWRWCDILLASIFTR